MVEPCLENFKNNDIKNSCIELDRIWVYNKNVLEKITKIIAIVDFKYHW